jgi:hypothetical protein
MENKQPYEAPELFTIVLENKQILAGSSPCLTSSQAGCETHHAPPCYSIPSGNY